MDETDEHSDPALAADATWRDLAAVERASSAWLAFVARADAEPQWLDAASWASAAQIRLERLLWHVHRTEATIRAWRRPQAGDAEPHPAAGDRMVVWRARLDRVMAARGLDSTYRAVMHPLDLDDEAVSVDAVTDLAIACAVVDAAGPVLIAAERHRAGPLIDGAVFTTVLAPWRNQGAPAVLRALQWLQAVRIDADTW